jgi:hypothetical protein
MSVNTKPYTNKKRNKTMRFISLLMIKNDIKIEDITKSLNILLEKRREEMIQNYDYLQIQSWYTLNKDIQKKLDTIISLGLVSSVNTTHPNFSDHLDEILLLNKNLNNKQKPKLYFDSKLDSDFDSESAPDFSSGSGSGSGSGTESGTDMDSNFNSDSGAELESEEEIIPFPKLELKLDSESDSEL